MEDFEKIKTDPNELKKNDLMNKLDMEYAHKLAYLGNEIEDQDFKKGDEAEEISDIMSRFKGKVLTFLMDSGYTDKNTLFYAEERVGDADTSIRIGAVKIRENEFEKKFRPIESEVKHCIMKIYDEKTREIVDKAKGNILQKEDETYPEVNKKMLSDFKTNNESIFLNLKSDLMGKLGFFGDDNKSYDFSTSIQNLIDKVEEELENEFDKRSRHHDYELDKIYSDKADMLTKESINDLDLKKEKEKKYDEDYKKLLDQWK